MGDSKRAGRVITARALVVAGRSIDSLRGVHSRTGRILHAGAGRSRRRRFIRADWLAKVVIRGPIGVARRRRRSGLQRLAANLGSVRRSTLAADLPERRGAPPDERYEQLRRRQRFGEHGGGGPARSVSYPPDGSCFTHLDRANPRWWF